MSVAGACAVCSQGEIEAACQQCGRRVCEDHFEESTGLCTECDAQFGSRRPGAAGRDLDDVDTFQQ